MICTWKDTTYIDWNMKIIQMKFSNWTLIPLQNFWEAITKWSNTMFAIIFSERWQFELKHEWNMKIFEKSANKTINFKYEFSVTYWLFNQDKIKNENEKVKLSVYKKRIHYWMINRLKSLPFLFGKKSSIDIDTSLNEITRHELWNKI